MKIITLLFFALCTFSLLAAQKKMPKDTLIGVDQIAFYKGYIATDSLTKGKIRIPLQKQKEQKIAGFSFIQPSELLYRKFYGDYRLHFLPNWTYRFPDRVLERLLVEYKVYIDDLNAIDYAPLFAPFYIKNEEVTNREYNEFVVWVRDSIARRILAEKFPEDFLMKEILKDGSGLKRLNWQKEFKYYDDEYMPLLSVMYMPEHERYYRRKEFSVSKFFYSYGSNLKRPAVAIYPDTLVWSRNLVSHHDPFLNMYFWHPAYDDFPVVGLSVPQVECYLHWKQKNMEQVLRKKFKKNITVELLLPDDHEFECAQLYLQKEAIKKGENPDLFFRKEANAVLEFADVIPQALLDSLDHSHTALMEYNHTAYSPNFLFPRLGGYYSNPKRIQKDGKGLSYLNSFSVYGNVSEWTRTRFDGLRMEMYLFFERLQENMSRKYPLLPHTIGVLRKFHKGDHLIIGANMLDIRNQVDDGLMAQSYAHPDSAFATVGFRYVIRIKEN